MFVLPDEVQLVHPHLWNPVTQTALGDDELIFGCQKVGKKERGRNCVNRGGKNLRLEREREGEKRERRERGRG